tara:strand:+ start:649 stop:1113 length:465 start_codon:yes stop_codon:yes gene_type:complete
MSNKRKFECYNSINYLLDNILNNNPNINKLINNFNKNLKYAMMSDNIDNYINYDKIEEDLNNNTSIYDIIKRNIKGKKNRCIECNQDIGECNPRQLCCKTYCNNNNFIDINFNNSETKIKCIICLKDCDSNSIVEFNKEILICNKCVIDKSGFK